ncbi:MAG TPA: M20/M25/M40 family metallo-hydrolase [Candidatus Latescibacteria bacterium]|nr:M20/M25/M40 family metallo-hydrolase [Candidatus Latescibacterota bacterium]HOS65269.1 M20/M25/M40 family metallo-hydrolase [Candidatus Latescibacterota bacterium]HPK75004.1 M20/M25/M40 family metallo-hydrolase [Candidatus Latescibacterota bacterium]
MSCSVVNLTKALVAIPSESSRSNLPVMQQLCTFLYSQGFRVTRYPQNGPSTGPEKTNLIAERGNGTRRLVFSGHLDTVPVGERAQWQHDPYGAEGIIGDRLYGRGAVDMKGQVAAMACACASVPEEVLRNLTLTLAITGDEEIGHIGIKDLAAKHVFERAVGCVVGEPTSLRVVSAHKGGMTVRFTVRGLSCHSSKPHLGVNAIEQAVRLLNLLRERLAPWCAQRHPAFGEEPPTFTVVGVSGGVADNVVPDSCTVNISARALETGHFETFRAALEGIISELVDDDTRKGVPPERRFSADIDLLKWAPPMVCDTAGVWYQTVARIAGQEKPEFVTYGTDAGVLNQVGLPCVVWGPGDIIRAHSVDEYITLEELTTAVTRYRELICAVAASELPTFTTSLWNG